MTPKAGSASAQLAQSLNQLIGKQEASTGTSTSGSQ
jgi:hypothetical protein